MSKQEWITEPGWRTIRDSFGAYEYVAHVCERDQAPARCHMVTPHSAPSHWACVRCQAQLPHEGFSVALFLREPR